MAFERQQDFYDDLRETAKQFLANWEHLKGLRDNFDAVGGEPFFSAFFAALPVKELTYNDVYAGVVAVNRIETAMAAGARDLYKVKG